MSETGYAMAHRHLRVDGRNVADRPETALLLCCARTHINSERVDWIKALLRQRIDWVYLLRTAYRHGVAPLLYRNLDSICPEAVPEVALKQLRRCYYTNARRNHLLTEELAKVLNALESQRVCALPFKGPVLAASAYGHLSLRQIGDLDILIHEKDVLRAMEILRKLGYRPSSMQSEAEQAAHLKSHYVCNFHCNHVPAPLDLQWGITCARHLSFPLDFDRLWERRELVGVIGMRLAQIPTEDLLLFLCVHGSRHRWSSLKWICDVAEFLRVNPGIHWDRLLERAHRVDCRRMLLLGLQVARDLLGTPLPRRINQCIHRDPSVKSLAGRVSQWLFLEEERQPRFLASTAFFFRTRERLCSKLPYLIDFLRTVATATEENRKRMILPGYLSVLRRLLEVVA